MLGKEEPSAQFDPDTLRDALHTVSHATTDLAFGTGQRYDLASRQASLEVFSEHQLARLTTPTSRLELFNAPTPQVIDGHVVFRRETGHDDTTVHVSPQGTVVFGYVSTAPAPSDGTSNVPVASDCDVAPEQLVTAASDAATAPETAQEPAATAATSPTAPLRTPTPRQQPRQTWQQHSESVAADPAPATSSHTDQPTQEQQPRLQLTGRLGRDPSFRTSPRGTFIGRFPLAVHKEDGTTTWHTILAFGDRAKQLQHRAETGELAKGQEVNLIGYQHTRAQPTRDGHTKTVTEIYAVAVTRR